MQIHKNFRTTPLAIAVALSVNPVQLASAQERTATLEEVIVSAHKREESVLDIPASVQALTAEDIKAQGSKNIGDYIRFVPSVNVIDTGAGEASIIFRGTATSPSAYVAQSSSSLYVDEVSVSTQGDQPSVRMVDIARVEALSGPQGTLYGSDSQSGTLRIITNQAELNTQEVILDLTAKDGSESEMSYDGSIVANFPVIEDKLAVRLVGFTAKDGGFIDNVLAPTPDLLRSGLGAEGAQGRAPSGWGSLDNADVVEDDINDYEVDGFRVSARWEINDDWAATFSYLNQSSESGSYNGYIPGVGDLETVRYNEESYDEDYEITGLVFEGDLGFAQFVSATSYYDSESEFTQDVTNYQKSYASYYCYASAYSSQDPNYYFQDSAGNFIYYDGGGARYCTGATLEGDSLAAFDEEITGERFSQEFRLSAEGDTFDYIVGAFYEDSSYTYDEWFGYPTKVEGSERQSSRGQGLYEDTVSFQYLNTFNPGNGGLEGSAAPFRATNTTDITQVAIFGEVDWHITEQLDLTLGARWFDREVDQFYNQEQPEFEPAFRVNKKSSDSEVNPKLGLSYDLDDEQMVYGLYSVGYRPGGVNRFRGQPAIAPVYEPDKLSNYELGYKGTLMDGAMQLTLTGFYMQWDDYQFELTDPAGPACESGPSVPGVCGQGFQNNISNAGDAHIMGAYFEVDWAISERFVVGFNGEWLEAESDTDVSIGDTDTTGLFVAEGSQLPGAPEWTAAAWATYYFDVTPLDADGYVRLQWSYTSETLDGFVPAAITDDTAFPRFTNAAYDIGDLSIGLASETWETILFVNNITDERAEYGRYGQGGYSQGISSLGVNNIESIYTNRPREVGIRIIKRWGG
jgi:outer membrane receptor protein involved in Fe transport